MIRCPRCGCAGGNEIDRLRQITLRCQFCGYPKRLRRDRWYFQHARRITGFALRITRAADRWCSA